LYNQPVANMSGERRESSASEASSTLSEFVRRRFAGDVPLFGGDPRVGAAELGASAANSFNAQLANALTGINDTLRSMDVRSHASVLRSPPTLRPPQMRNLDPSGDELRDALELDDDKIRLLLDSSLVETRDVARYYALLSVARDGLRKKQAALEVSRQRKVVSMKIDFAVSGEEIAAAFGSQMTSVKELAGRLGLESETGVALLSRALVHDSRFGGRSTNRPLALVGDTALALMLKEKAFERGVSVGDASGALQATQSNVVLRDVGVRYKLDQYVLAGVNIDVTSRNVMSTVVEAIFGVLYMEEGMGAVRRVNAEELVVCEFDRMFGAS